MAQPPQKRQRTDGVQKRLKAPELPRGPHDVLVSHKTSLNTMYAKALAILKDTGCDAVTLHGMGHAAPRCCELALALQKTAGFPLEMEVTTGTVLLTDLFEPRDELEGDPCECERFNSSIRVRLIKERAS